MTIRKSLRIERMGIADAIENAKLNEEDVKLLQHILNLHDMAINRKISYEELDKAIESTRFWSLIDDKNRFVIFLGGKPSPENQLTYGIRKKLKAIRKGVKGGWDFFYSKEKSLLNSHQEKRCVSEMKKLSFDDFIGFIHSRFSAILRYMSVQDVSKFILVDYYRKTVLVMLPLSKTENYLLIFKYCERKWCTTMSKVKEHIKSAINAAKKIYAFERRRIGNVTLFLIGESYSMKIPYSAVRYFFQKLAQHTGLSKRKPEPFIVREDWRKFTVKTLINFLKRRVKGIKDECYRKRVKPYNDTLDFIIKLKKYMVGITEAIAKGVDRLTLYRAMDAVS